MESDEALISAYLGGDDEGAFTELVERHLKSSYGFALRSTRSASDAEDIVQESFLKAWKNLFSFDPKKARFKTWLMRIVRNTMIDVLRKRKTLPLPLEEHETAEDVRDDAPLPDEIAARAQDTEALVEALEKLPLSYREILLLYHGNDFSIAEASAILDIPVNTGKSRYRRALQALREALLHPKE